MSRFVDFLETLSDNPCYIFATSTRHKAERIKQLSTYQKQIQSETRADAENGLVHENFRPKNVF